MEKSIEAVIIVYVLSVIPFLFFITDEQYVEVSTGAKFSMSLVPMVAASIGCNTLIEFEMTGVLLCLFLSIIFNFYGWQKYVGVLGNFHNNVASWSIASVARVAHSEFLFKGTGWKLEKLREVSCVFLFVLTLLTTLYTTMTNA